MAMNHYSWGRFRQLRDQVTHLDSVNGEAVVLTGPDSPPTSALRIITFPQVVSRWDPSVTGTPPPGWWTAAQVTCSVTWIPDGSAISNPDEMGQADPPAVSLGFVKLYPRLTHAGTNTTQYAVTWTPENGKVEFESGRRTDSGPSPTVVVAVWPLDSGGVFHNPLHTVQVTHSLVNYGSVLWNNIF